MLKIIFLCIVMVFFDTLIQFKAFKIKFYHYDVYYQKIKPLIFFGNNYKNIVFFNY